MSKPLADVFHDAMDRVGDTHKVIAADKLEQARRAWADHQAAAVAAAAPREDAPHVR